MSALQQAEQVLAAGHTAAAAALVVEALDDIIDPEDSTIEAEAIAKVAFLDGARQALFDATARPWAEVERLMVERIQEALEAVHALARLTGSGADEGEAEPLPEYDTSLAGLSGGPAQ
ncbi:hypothetical protein [Devosia sp.]|jgi:hypothetical protein|uniref:hypothetical protein n=1 Tax=Devosia sp. TaxID=1871048 RepID=UPI0037BF8F70